MGAKITETQNDFNDSYAGKLAGIKGGKMAGQLQRSRAGKKRGNGKGIWFRVNGATGPRPGLTWFANGPKLRRMSILAAGNQPGPYRFFGIFFGGFILVTGVVSLIIRRGGKKNLMAVAERLGFTVTPKFQISSANRSLSPVFSLGVPRAERGIEGTVRGRAVRISEFVADSGEHEQTWLELAVDARANGFTFSLHWKGITRKLVERFGAPEITTGEEEFDRRWRIHASDVETLRTAIPPGLRVKIDRSSDKFGEFCLDNDWMRYRERATIFNAGPVKRMEGMVDWMCDLAESIEAVTKKNKEG
jgi:hypothetical protein